MIDLRAPHDGWRLVDEDAIKTISQRSFVSGDPASNAIRSAYFFRDGDNAVVGRAWFGPGAEGPPRHAHGGSIAALLDEVMGFAGWLKGHRVLAKKIEVSFLRSIPLQSVVTFEGHVVEVNGRDVKVRGAIFLPDGTRCAEGLGTFTEVSMARLNKMLQG